MAASLAALQRRFVERVLSPKGSKLPGALPGGKLSPEGALGVYRDGYSARLSQALGETFESCWWVLGDKAFLGYCEAYLRKHPSKEYNLSAYGADFPAFIAKTPEAKKLPFLPELARFEWEFKELFHQKELPSALASELARAQATGDMKLDLTPAMRLFEHRYAVSEVWRKRKSPQSAYKKLVWKKPEWVLLYKKQGDVYLLPLGRAEHELLVQVGKGKTLGQAFESVLKGPDPITPPRVAALFNSIADAGIITRLEPLG